MTQLDDMVDAYVECALWAGLDWTREEDGNCPPLDDRYGPEDVSPEARASIVDDCRSFLDDDTLADDLTLLSAEQCGCDFYLTRNGHGAGFWDRGLGEAGDRLSAAAKAYGTAELYPGDDGLLYESN